MGTGYLRQSTGDIIAGNVIEAGPINDEFNQLQSAFNASSGHSHDGTVGEGPKISLTSSISGILPVANGGIAGIHKLNATTSPTVNNDIDEGYVAGSMWVDLTGDEIYFCVDNTDGAAVWLSIPDVSGYQPLDATLTALAALSTSADQLIYSTGTDTFAMTGLTSFARSILDDANEATFKATVNLEIGTDVQAYNANLTTYATTAPTAAGLALLDDANAAAQLVTLGLSATASEINVLDGVAASTAEINHLSGVTSAIQTQLDAKQPLDADLTAIAALNGTNTIYYRSAANTWSAVTIGSGLDFSAGTLSNTGGVSDGDKGDIVVSSSGAVWSIDTGVIVNADINASAAIDATKIHDGSISNTEFGYLNGVTSAIQTQLDTKITASSTNTLTNKTFDANGTGNSLSNVEVADFAASAIVIESEGIGSNDNDTTLPTSAAVKDYVDNNAGGWSPSGQTWQDVTGSRADNVVYQNTTGAPIQVLITIAADSNDQEFDISTDNSVFTRIAEPTNSSDVCISAVIYENLYYRMNVRGGGAILHWAELR